MHDHLFAAHAYTQGMSCARPAKVFKLLPHFPANCLQPTIDDTLHFQTGYFALDNYHNSDFPRFQASLPQLLPPTSQCFSQVRSSTLQLVSVSNQIRFQKRKYSHP